jgi:hypothetical protein
MAELDLWKELISRVPELVLFTYVFIRVLAHEQQKDKQFAETIERLFQIAAQGKRTPDKRQS